MKQHITYEKTRITVDYPKPIRIGQCSACLRKVGEGIKQTQNHHTIYAYTIATVKKNPLLALKNRMEVGYGCHQIADALRGLILASPRGGMRSVNRIMQVLKLLPMDQQEHFGRVCQTFLAYWTPILRQKEVINETKEQMGHGT